MAYPCLSFIVTGQHIKRTDKNRIVADSRNYLSAVFSFSEEWTYPVTALFGGGGKILPALISYEGEQIQIPPDAIKKGNMTVSCYCGNLITSDFVTINVNASGYSSFTDDMDSSEEMDYYNQLISLIDQNKVLVAQINSLIGGDAESQDAVSRLQGIIDKAQSATALPDQTVIGQMDALIDQYISNEDAVANQLIDGTIEFIDSSVETVRSYAFSSCPNLRAVTLRNAKEIKTNAFRENSLIYEADLRNVYIVNENAFYYCINLRKINLSSAVIFSGYSIFNSCRQLTKVDLPVLEEMGMSTFTSSSNLDTVIIRTSKLCVAQNATSFNNTKIKPGSGTATGYVYVPRNLVEEYKSATNWTIIADRIRAIEDYPDICAPEEWED